MINIGRERERERETETQSKRRRTLLMTIESYRNPALTTLFACSTGMPLKTESSERFFGRPAVAGSPITSVIVVGRP